MDWITKGAIDILEKGDSTGSLAVLLAFAQITLHFIHTDLSYSTWFEVNLQLKSSSCIHI
ncbi:hypothetical protein BCV71DRAFT_172868 [Rhizopus microsporus]|uniref:Uncharacterized protein n=1 Tax=Rhizopus microsporus TaxID=58291 RepID=A0A1X0SCG7_RHIZD|nr:hypothetical protein BCV71DRAFT_172868 [Rhizopus microsporus]